MIQFVEIDNSVFLQVINVDGKHRVGFLARVLRCKIKLANNDCDCTSCKATWNIDRILNS